MTDTADVVQFFAIYFGLLAFFAVLIVGIGWGLSRIFDRGD